MTKATLLLQDGSTFSGFSFGAHTETSGEVVFNTGMMGYPESLTDPSYAGQILVSTFPLQGNYGIPSYARDKSGLLKHFESARIRPRAFIVSENCTEPSHWTSTRTLSDWLASEDIPGIYGIDTRALTQKLREHGVMLGRITLGNKKPRRDKIENPNKLNLVAEVSTDKVQIYGRGARKKKVLFVDCGGKYNIIRSFLNRGVSVIRVPWDHDFTDTDYDGLFISNGPGDPKMADKTVKNLRKALKDSKPILGICLGNQLLARAAGAKTYKLKYGHRSQNQPCVEVGTKRCYITSQNHGYAVDEKTLPRDWKPWFRNANDDTNEGIIHKKKPFMAVQFHPEATPGPEDSEWIFDEFIKKL